jgi:hypothetical protein
VNKAWTNLEKEKEVKKVNKSAINRSFNSEKEDLENTEIVVSN